MSLDTICLPAHNPSPMTGGGNNTYLLLAANGDAVLVDAGVGNPVHVAELGTALKKRDAWLRRVLVTHGHADHASGVVVLSNVFPGVPFMKYPWPEEDRKYAVAWEPLEDNARVPLGDEVLVSLHTPGHSPDHMAFWHEPSRTVFSGDLVTAGSSVMIHASRGGNLIDYLASLERLLALGPRVLLPAHGVPPQDPEALLSGYIEHRKQREQQVLAALAAGRSTIQAIADSIYDGLDPALMPAARENVRAHLEKLKAEHRAAEDDDGWRACEQLR